MEIVLMEMAFK